MSRICWTCRLSPPLSLNAKLIYRLYVKYTISAWYQASAAKETRIALFWLVTQWVLVISYRRFGICCPEMSVRNYHHSLRNKPEEGCSRPSRWFDRSNNIILCLQLQMSVQYRCLSNTDVCPIQTSVQYHTLNKCKYRIFVVSRFHL